MNTNTCHVVSIFLVSVEFKQADVGTLVPRAHIVRAQETLATVII